MYTQIIIKNFTFFSLQYIRMSGKNINFDDKKIKKSMLNVMSKRFIVSRFVSTSMAKPVSLNTFTIFLRIRSVCWPFTFVNMRSLSSLYRPQSFLLINFLIFQGDKSRSFSETFYPVTKLNFFCDVFHLHINL